MKKKTSLIYPQTIIERSPPRNLKKEDAELFEKSMRHLLKPVNLFEYKNVCVTPEGIVFKGLKLDKDLLIFTAHKKTYNKLYLLSSLIKRKKIILPENETYLLVFDYWSNAIFHWMCDALPRLAAVKEKAKNTILLIPDNYQYQYIYDSLKPFQFKTIFKIPLNSYVKCPHLISPKQITESGYINPENIKQVRDTIINYYKPSFKNIEKNENIYISRTKAKYRKVLNEKELIPILKQYNFKIIDFEDMSFLEQIECCHYAKNIISIHGANLTNCVFIQPNTNVLEFRKQNHWDNNFFYEITDSFQSNYYYQVCEAIDYKPGFNFFDLIVNLALFKDNLNKMRINLSSKI